MIYSIRSGPILVYFFQYNYAPGSWAILFCSFLRLPCLQSCLVLGLLLGKRALFSKFVRHLTGGHPDLLLDSLGTIVTSAMATTSHYSAHSHIATKQTQAHAIPHNTGLFCLPAASYTSHGTAFKALTPMNYRTVQKKHMFSRLSFAASFPNTAKPQSRTCNNEPSRRMGQTATLKQTKV